MLVIYLKQQYNKYRSQLTEYFFPIVHDRAKRSILEPPKNQSE